jgi:hypothetical protein
VALRDCFQRLVLACVSVAVAGPATPGSAEDKKAGNGWVQLFNGKDLTGWKTHPDDKAQWRVVDGAIVGSGPSGHLYSERGDYENFRFRIEAKINDKGNSGQYFRTSYSKGFPRGYEAQINATHGDPVRSGSLYPDSRDRYSDEEKKGMVVGDQLIKPDEWFTQEVIADGNHIIIRLNGMTTVDFVDEKKRHATGHFAFQQHHEGSVVTIRKAEVEELPRSG